MSEPEQVKAAYEAAVAGELGVRLVTKTLLPMASVAPGVACNFFLFGDNEGVVDASVRNVCELAGVDPAALQQAYSRDSDLQARRQQVTDLLPFPKMQWCHTSQTKGSTREPWSPSSASTTAIQLPRVVNAPPGISLPYLE